MVLAVYRMQKHLRSPTSPLFESHSNGNALLSDQARREARLLLLDAEGALPRLDIELFNTPIENSLVLQTQRAAIVDRAQPYRAAIAPHRAIPNEILSEIFSLCTDTICVPIDLTAPPWSLARYIIKGIVYTTLDTRGKHTKFFRARLKRVTLTFVLEFGSSFFQLPPGPLHLVDTLDISLGGPYYTTGDVTVFQNGSKLREVILNEGGYPSVHLCLYKFPWSQLINLRINNAAVSTYDAHIMLQQCTQLAECHLPIRKSHPDTQEVFMLGNILPTRLPNLKSLLIECISGLGEFLRCLDLPGLAKLETFHQSGFKSAEGCSEDEWKTEFVPFFNRIQDLKRLCIRQPVPETIVEPILRAVPSVVAFTLQEGDELTSATLELIAMGGLIPKVEEIYCYAVQVNPFLDMIEYRGLGSTPCSKLKKVFLDMDTHRGGMDYSSRQRVESLRVAGHLITIRG
ncbi:hypothetical protein BDZ94DRAFT_1311413 [Collybia nuda]|uniref:Uncharacterized protein n=1 Tax=Collybia nuda TaxID=64659 RepID=A0A9P6CH43_9AGAR|nr:hypothetical protein BDZ94DRAFT_1311413 [Collybia nuda]